MVGTYSVNSGKFPDSNIMIEQIGQKLRNARESKGFSLGQIYDRTKIPTNHLESIENGRFDDLPEQVYVVGFIKRYADCVGLNGQNLVDEYRKQIEALNEENNKKGIFGIKTNKSNVAQAAPIPQAHIHKTTRVAPPAPNFANMVFYPAILIILLSGLISYLFYYQQQQFAMQQDPSVNALRESASKFNTVSSANQATTASNQTNTGTPAVLPGKGDAQVSLTASQHVWVEVKSVGTGESLFTGYLESGDRREFTDAQGLKVRAGNGASLNVVNNGKNETFGTSGQVVDRVFMSSNPQGAASTATGTTTTGGSVLGAGTDLTPAQIKAAKAAKAAASARKAKATASARRSNDVPDRYVPGEGKGSIGAPYRYTEPESY
ncbi:helix-turn-helix domain-containing protein [bacterium]|nr:helix-turn-helix domain-containing protein [bacterium]QQR59675.1 MAG: helix-turn-helix domain-containing protein [Candidatus Melainabacteria bacterium]